MDTYRGNYLDIDLGDDWPEVEFGEEEALREPPPSPVGQDERRMQVRAYNHWASLLGDRSFPSIEDLDRDALPDFGPYSVMLDFTKGIENPAIRFLGSKLAEECGIQGRIETLEEVPARSLLSRITDHYMQILANQAPIGFEAEFVNQNARTILYRGILLPFSSDDENIDYICGVINWKELADQATTDELMLEIDQALDEGRLLEARRSSPITDWADGPADPGGLAEPDEANEEPEDILDLAMAEELLDEVEAPEKPVALPQAATEPEPEPRPVLSRPRQLFASPVDLDDDGAEDEDEGNGYQPIIPLDLRSIVRIQGDLLPLRLRNAEEQDAEPAAPDHVEEAAERSIELAPVAEADMGLGDWLASARELAEAARGSEDRTRSALYEAIGKAYDFSLAAAEAPEEFAELVAESGLTVQDRAPLTPVVKLVFGADYDKTRLTEYATALSHAQRLGLGRGTLASYLSSAPGGLKGVVSEERRLKREESGKAQELRDCPREALAKKLRLLDHAPLDAVAAEGAEFTLLVARRLPSGEVVLLGEVADDIPLLEKAAKKLIG
ncbi:PAS domain-containing protein [Novosphingobium sp. NPDC080210]|uniref:PAS domain-containing protein n=1 Tax=Novosphingobium sp. NPDC080210 TaxID=3390596 RepID=UPI003D0475F0